MSDNSINFLDQSNPPVSFKPKLKDRGNGVFEAIHGVSKIDGTQVNPATSEGQASILTALAALALGTDVQAGTAKGEQMRALLASILTAIQAQRVETIWTDDTGTRFLRVDVGGTIVWTDVTGAASSAPGAGARPDSDSGTVVSRASYKTTTSGTGFASGDLVDHIVVTDGDVGDLVSNFWINVTAGTKIAPPSVGAISPISVLPDGAATQITLEAVRAAVAGTLTVQGNVTVSDGAGPLTVDGNVAVSNFPATQAVSGPITDTQLRAAPLPVSGPATDAQLRATALPVSGPLTDTQLRAVALPVSIAAEVEVKNDAGNPLTNSEQPVQGVIDMPTAATVYTAGRAVEIVTTTAGTVTFTYADGSTRTRNLTLGTTIYPHAVTRWDKPTSPASAWVGTICNLK